MILANARASGPPGCRYGEIGIPMDVTHFRFLRGQYACTVTSSCLGGSYLHDLMLSVYTTYMYNTTIMAHSTALLGLDERKCNRANVVSSE